MPSSTISTVTCPHCAHANKTSAAPGQQIRCAACGQAMQIREPSQPGLGWGQILIGGLLTGAALYGGYKAIRALTAPSIFISHAWQYNDDYYRLVGLLDAANDFPWKNVSVPEHDPLPGGLSWQLERQIRAEVESANAVLVISGMYANHRVWIQKEMDMAQELGKPIIGIRPWGAQVLPAAVEAVAVEMVGWRTTSIVEAVERHAR